MKLEKRLLFDTLEIAGLAGCAVSLGVALLNSPHPASVGSAEYSRQKTHQYYGAGGVALSLGFASWAGYRGVREEENNPTNEDNYLWIYLNLLDFARNILQAINV